MPNLWLEDLVTVLLPGALLDGVLIFFYEGTFLPYMRQLENFQNHFAFFTPSMVIILIGMAYFSGQVLLLGQRLIKFLVGLIYSTLRFVLSLCLYTDHAVRRFDAAFATLTKRVENTAYYFASGLRYEAFRRMPKNLLDTRQKMRYPLWDKLGYARNLTSKAEALYSFGLVLILSAILLLLSSQALYAAIPSAWGILVFYHQYTLRKLATKMNMLSLSLSSKGRIRQLRRDLSL